MINWLLVVFLAMPGEQPTQAKIGLMNGAAICDLTGRAVIARLTIEEPEARVGYVCLQQVAA